MRYRKKEKGGGPDEPYVPPDEYELVGHSVCVPLAVVHVLKVSHIRLHEAHRTHELQCTYKKVIPRSAVTPLTTL